MHFSSPQQHHSLGYELFIYSNHSPFNVRTFRTRADITRIYSALLFDDVVLLKFERPESSHYYIWKVPVTLQKQTGRIVGSLQ